MATLKGGTSLADDWVEAETKAPDDMSMVDRIGRGPRTLTVMQGKGKKKKAVKLRIPAALFPEMKRFVSPEVWSAVNIADPATGASQISCYTLIAQGTTAQTRNGDMIRVIKAVLRMYFRPNSSAVPSSTVDLAAVQDSEPAAGVPTFPQVFQGGLASLYGYHCAVPNYDKRGRFVSKKRDAVPQVTTAAYISGGGVTSLYVRPVTLVWDIPINRVVKYDGANARPYQGSELEIFAWSDVSANMPTAWAALEIFFVDV